MNITELFESKEIMLKSDDTEIVDLALKAIFPKGIKLTLHFSVDKYYNGDYYDGPSWDDWDEGVHLVESMVSLSVFDKESGIHIIDISNGDDSCDPLDMEFACIAELLEEHLNISVSGENDIILEILDMDEAKDDMLMTEYSFDIELKKDEEEDYYDYEISNFKLLDQISQEDLDKNIANCSSGDEEEDEEEETEEEDFKTIVLKF